MGNPPLVHGRIEVLSDNEGEKSAKQRSLEIMRGGLGEEVAELVLANAVPEYSDIEDDLNDLGWKLKKRGVPQGRGGAGVQRMAQEGRGHPRHSPDGLRGLQERYALLR